MSRCLLKFVAIIVLLPAGFVTGAEEEAKSNDEVRRAADLLQSVIKSLEVETDAVAAPKFELRESPLLKYSDPARGYAAGGVWRLGKAGRPAALVSLQYSLRAEMDKPRLDYELISLVEQPFEVKWPRATLNGEGSALKFADLKVAETPASTEKQRLSQLRSLARRFTASEVYGSDSASLRLLTQPLDRYTDASQGVVDGAVFTFAYGTNPELMLLLEAEETQWRYALSRMAWAELTVKFDGTEIARFDALTDQPSHGAYRTGGHFIDLETSNP